MDCVYCRGTLDPATLRCQNCGRDQPTVPSTAPIPAPSGALTRHCPTCGDVLPIQARFCGRCGQPSGPLPQPEAEHRSGHLIEPGVGAEAEQIANPPHLPSAPAAAQSGAPTVPNAPADPQTGAPSVPHASAGSAGAPGVPHVPAGLQSGTQGVSSTLAGPQSGAPGIPSAPAGPQSGAPGVPGAPAGPQAGAPTVPGAPAGPQTGAPAVPKAPVSGPGTNTLRRLGRWTRGGRHAHLLKTRGAKIIAVSVVTATVAATGAALILTRPHPTAGNPVAATRPALSPTAPATATQRPQTIIHLTFSGVVAGQMTITQIIGCGLSGTSSDPQYNIWFECQIGSVE
jgi:hypothetical protein